MTQQTFTKVKETFIPSLNITLQEYEHNVTKAKHIHLANDDSNNVFLVGFLTVPEDSTGVAHILEHTALCGSENYPVRDPFFMMIRRSLNTFMNAFTSSDWTAYPFASQNKKDFYNLLDVYLDAAFFPQLEYLDFLQEGHRLEFSEIDNPESELVYKGVVFNEMKGAMSSIGSILYQELTKALFPTTTYHNNSGGDPEDIPNLTHEALVNFHKKHYHPSNSVFMTYGNMDPLEHQAVFEEKVLSKFDYQDFDFSVKDEKRYTEPQKFTATYPLPVDEPLEKQSHVINSWLLNPIMDADELMRARILSSVLVDNASSPLRLALETSDLGTAPSIFCGLEEGTREAFFSCGLEGANGDESEKINQLIVDTLIQVRDEGVPQESIEAALHQLELASREISGDRYPYGLRLIVDTLTPVLHGGEAYDALSFDESLKKMREEIQDRNFIPNLIDRLLLNNPHRVMLTVNPSHTLADERVAKEKARLAEIQSSLTEADKEKIIREAKALQARQSQIDDDSILPMVTREDIPKKLTFPELNYQEGVVLGSPTTNGMTYQSIVVDLPALTEEEMVILPFLDAFITEMGAGSRSYLEQQARISAVTGGVSARTMYQPYDGDIRGYWVLSGKALLDHSDALASLLRDIFFDARFDEVKRMQEIMAQIKVGREQGIVSNGHSYAMGVASQNISLISQLEQRLSGMQSIKDFREIEKRMKDDTECRAFGEKLAALLTKLQQSPYEIIVLNDSEQIEKIGQDFAAVMAHNVTEDVTRFSAPFSEHSEEKVYLGWAINAPVFYCAKSYKTVTRDHQDSPVFQVLTGFLRNGYLHRAIREQGGAYGGGANYNASSGAFNFFSYRDPRLEETLADFDASIVWLLENEHDEQQLEEAILGVISAIDRPKAPASEYGDRYFMAKYDRTPEDLEQYRAAVLNVTIDDLKRVAREYLANPDTHTAVLGPKAALEAAGFEVKQL
ncbi:peptidase M16 [Ignatzschineria indica]|uniref:Peptidase M16 n=1 Tax=Ignatzschineria indica TaxID=472583 RepID=A0A2U2ANP2_9GAMM|nr:insulinase family protein [Ignatzschineria indica]PWD84822.1 peptidase M16 [Ignatzschineria indica]GGZ79391.1 peptidase M16 [Ignatzschineria indica]